MLSEAERHELSAWSHNGSATAAVQRALIVLLADEGLPEDEISRRLGVSRPTVRRWVRRFAEEGVAGMRDRPRTGRPRSVEDVELVLRTLLPRGGGAPGHRWSSRRLAAELDLSASTIAQVWRRWGVRPDEPQSSMLPTVPELTVRISDIVGLLHNGGDLVLAVRLAGMGDRVGRGGRFLSESLIDGSLGCSLVRTPPGARPSELGGFLRVLTERFAGHRISIVCAQGATLRTESARRVLAVHRNLACHVAADREHWPQVAAVALGMAALRPSGEVPAEFTRGTLAGLRRIAGQAGPEVHWIGGDPA